MLVNGKWVEPTHVRFSPAGILVVFANVVDDHGRSMVFGFAVRSVVLDGSFGPMEVVYRYFMPGEGHKHPYFTADEPCEFIN